MYNLDERRGPERRLGRFGSVVALLAFSAAVSQAAAMSALLAGGSVSCGNLTFQNFRNFVSNSAGGADAPTADQVFVNPDAGNCATFSPGPGLIFQRAQWNVNAGGSIDTAFTFDVLVTGTPIFPIGDARLGLLSFDAQQGGEIHITESIFDSLNNNIVNLSVDSLTGPITDTHTFGQAYTFLTVNKDVSLEGHTGGNAALSTFTQNFSEVPEPATTSLLSIGLGAIILGSARLKRKAKR